MSTNSHPACLFLLYWDEFLHGSCQITCRADIMGPLDGKAFQPQDERSLMLRTHCQTSGASLAEQDPYNNIIRTTIEAMAATLGGTQSLHTNSFDEAISLPTDFSARIARNTQLILQHETGITDTVDPLAGSYYVENLTADLISKANALITEIQDMGGMTKAVQDGLPKREIEKWQLPAKLELIQGQDVIVGVNKFKLSDEEPIDILDMTMMQCVHDRQNA